MFLFDQADTCTLDQYERTVVLSPWFGVQLFIHRIHGGVEKITPARPREGAIRKLALGRPGETRDVRSEIIISPFQFQFHSSSSEFAVDASIRLVHVLVVLLIWYPEYVELVLAVELEERRGEPTPHGRTVRGQWPGTAVRYGCVYLPYDGYVAALAPWAPGGCWTPPCQITPRHRAAGTCGHATTLGDWGLRAAGAVSAQLAVASHHTGDGLRHKNQHWWLLRARYRDATTWARARALNVGQRHEGRAGREARTAGG